jgi:hypothetical protein
MDAIEYVEKTAAATLAQACCTYDGMLERVYKFSTLVAGGAGGAGVYALGKIGSATASQVVPLAALSCWWFLIAGITLLHGAKSNAMKAGTSGNTLRERLLYHQRDGTYDEATALWYTRWDQLRSVDQQIVEYSDAASKRAQTLDRAYWCLACSPAVAVLAYLLTF